jgi:hypothetical protein
MVATVHNQGGEDFDAAELVFRVDDAEERSYVLRVPAGESRSRSLPFRFADAGYHSVSAEVRGDGLLADNTRYRAVRVLDSADVLLVDGDPGASPRERETLLLEVALQPGESDDFRRSPYHPVVVTPDQFLGDGLDLRPFVAVVLANVAVADFPLAAIERLGRYVRDGGALLVFGGSNVRPEEYNAAFHTSETRLLPLPMLGVVDRTREPEHVRLGDTQNQLGGFFAAREEFSYLGTEMIEFRRYVRFGAAEPEEPEARTAPPTVVLRFSDAEGSPAAFVSPYGRGATLWFASSADVEWNDFPKFFDFVAFVHEAIPYLVSFGQGRSHLELGTPIREEFDAVDFAPDVLVIPPRPLDDDSAVVVSIAKSLEKVEGENRFRLVHEETRHPGFYRVSLKRPSRSDDEWSERELVYAVNVDPGEGVLEPLTRDQVSESFPQAEIDFVDAGERSERVTRSGPLGGGTEFWRQALWAVLALLVAETVLARLFGRSLR